MVEEQAMGLDDGNGSKNDYSHLDKSSPRYNPDLMAEILRVKSPEKIDAIRLAEYAKESGSVARVNGLVANISNYYRDAKDGWKFVRRMKDDDGIVRTKYIYWFDDSIPPRRPEKKLTDRGGKGKELAVREKPVSVKAIEQPTQTFAMVIYSDDEEVILMDDSKKLIRGRYVD